MSGRNSDPRKPVVVRPGFLGRTRAMSSGGSSGWEATTIGFTLVGCIVACSALGYWLDNHFKTSYWLPILFLVGVIAGFREMFVVLGRISKEQEQKKLEQREKVQLAPNPVPDIEPIAEPQARERIFKVPPPPVAGEKIQESERAEEKAAPESVEDLLARLMEDGRDESRDENELDKPQ